MQKFLKNFTNIAVIAEDDNEISVWWVAGDLMQTPAQTRLVGAWTFNSSQKTELAEVLSGRLRIDLTSLSDEIYKQVSEYSTNVDIKRVLRNMHFESKKAETTFQELEKPKPKSKRKSVPIFPDFTKYEEAFGHFRMSSKIKDSVQIALTGAKTMESLLNAWENFETQVKPRNTDDVSINQRDIFFFAKEDL